jgi:hypothetical protein
MLLCSHYCTYVIVLMLLRSHYCTHVIALMLLCSHYYTHVIILMLLCSHYCTHVIILMLLCSHYCTPVIALMLLHSCYCPWVYYSYFCLVIAQLVVTLLVAQSSFVILLSLERDIVILFPVAERSYWLCNTLEELVPS